MTYLSWLAFCELRWWSMLKINLLSLLSNRIQANYSSTAKTTSNIGKYFLLCWSETQPNPISPPPYPDPKKKKIHFLYTHLTEGETKRLKIKHLKSLNHQSPLNILLANVFNLTVLPLSIATNNGSKLASIFHKVFDSA